MSKNTKIRRFRWGSTAAVALVLVATGCTSNSPDEEESSGDSENTSAASSNDDTGETVTIGFSGPAADHGWLGAINSSALAEAEKYDDIELQTAEGTNDANLQISQVETFINDKVDAIVLLPTDGAALTDVATQAMDAGIPVVNVDREFSDPFAARDHDPRRQLRHGRLGGHLRLRADRGERHRRPGRSRRSRASTRCR